MKSIAAPQKEGPRINREIRAREVQLIDSEGKNHGVIQLPDALGIAEAAGLDLVEIAPEFHAPRLQNSRLRRVSASPSKRRPPRPARSRRVVEVKEIKLRPGIDDHDYGVKMKAVRRFFEEGDKVKVTLRFRGREIAHQDIGYRLLSRVKAETATLAKVELEPSMEGRQMVMVLAPR